MDKNQYKELIAEYMKKESKLKNRVSELEKENTELRENFRRLHRLHTFGTPTDGLEVGSPSDYEDKMIYESPDGGETVYGRRFNEYSKRTKIKDPRDISKDE